MKIDLYTKTVLTVIAAALMVIASRPLLETPPAFARSAEAEAELTALEADIAEIAADTTLLADMATTLAAIGEDAALLERVASELAELRMVAVGIAKADFPCTNRMLCGGPD